MSGKDHEIVKVCAYCERGRQLADGDSVLCALRGVVDASAHCRRFRYDPLKRVPAPPQTVVRLDEDEDLTL